MSSITRFLPKNHLSYFMGQLVHIPLPQPLNKWLIAIFAKHYRIQLEEAEKPIEQYPSLGEFFVRRLKAGIRPIASSWAVHPADSVITQASPMKDGKLIQAKGKTYNVTDFTADPKALAKWENGTFLTYYLCPTDYHRVHSPVTGKIRRVVHIPGNLWPVNNWSTDTIFNLFSINERVLVEIETDRGLVGVMFVGATNVGQIELSFEKSFKGNQLIATKPVEFTYTNEHITKGEELGMFRMGSTVVMLYAQGALPSSLNVEGLLQSTVKVNSHFAD